MTSADDALTIRGLTISRGERTILRGVDLDVASGELCALMGASGAGKSTILRAVAALEPFSAGSIAVAGAALVPGPIPPQSGLAAIRSSVGMVFQMHALFEHLTAIENVVLAPIHVLGWPVDRARAAARDLLAQLGVEHRADALPRQLSGGEAQRVAIARALINDPAVLLMDEPTAALDPARRNDLGSILKEVAAGGRAVLMATHDMEFARSHASRAVILDNGSLRGTTLA